MKMIYFLLLLMIPNLAFSEETCKEVDSGYAFFNAKKSSWIETEKVTILDCQSHFKLSLNATKNQKELDSVNIQKPAATEKWYFDGLSCNVSNDKNNSIGKNKAILSSVVGEGKALIPIQSWAVNPKSKKFEKIVVKVVCHKDEP